MKTKKSARAGLETNGAGHKGNNSTVSPDTDHVKDQLEYFSQTFTRFSYQDAIQQVIGDYFPDFQNKNYCKCHRVPAGAYADLMRNPETLRAYYSGVVTCANPTLCPICSVRIMLERAEEIQKAVHQWLNEDIGNTCYMITLTFAHTLKDNLAFLLQKFSQARKAFWENNNLIRILKRCGRVGRITGLEIMYSLLNGWHPHQHILLFCRYAQFDKAKLASLWLNALTSVGLSGLSEIAFDIVEARTAGDYLTKISREMALPYLKQGRKEGHFSPFQLMHEVVQGEVWAQNRFAELFFASRGTRALVWSPGLKARFGITELSDQQITDGGAGDALSLFCRMLEFQKLTVSQKSSLRNAAAVGDYDKATTILAGAGIQFSFNQGKAVS